MPLVSMTGFARSDGAHGPWTWFWEARSVNGRGLDVRLRLPSGTEAIEAAVRSAAGQRLSRGNVTLGLTLRCEDASGAFAINEAALAVALAAARRLAADVPGMVIDAAGLLALKGVLEVAEPGAGVQGGDTSQRDAALIETATVALDRLAAMRREEGARLARILAQQIDEIERLTAHVSGLPARQPAAVRQRLADAVARLTGIEGVDPARLNQEAALLAVKGDIAEELDRLGSHVQAARALLDADEAVGRKLDFLTQEFNREANTLCSKSSDIETTRAGLALKAIIDQVREQVQNIE